ncbi:MAG: DUF1640 domain-containing protein [Acidobacteriota bacterium]|nr:DUF1640 domain-containing protein [Acidobacteriota bacterium]
MSALAFDTYKAVTALKQAGFEEAQAEAVVNTMGEALGGNVATKADLTEVRAALEADMTAMKTALETDIAAVKADIEQLRSETKADLATMRADMETLRADMAEQFTTLYKQLWLMAVGIVGLTVTLVKLIP